MATDSEDKQAAPSQQPAEVKVPVIAPPPKTAPELFPNVRDPIEMMKSARELLNKDGK
jgi:hypothetical protein